MVSLFDVGGNILHKETVKNAADKLTIDISTLPNGIYFLKVEEENRSEYFKVEVMH